VDDLGEIWREHAAAVLRVCRAYLGHDRADDALGRVSLAAQRSFGRSRAPVENPRAWLLAIARNVCFDVHRERGRAVVHGLPDDALDRLAAEVAVCLDHGNPERQYLLRERMRCLENALRSLAPELRESLRAIAEGESDYAVLAQSIGITPAALRKRIQRARSILRERLNERERACRQKF
jgi:RNA polymerase sigma factor (sigma-70 family)